MPKEGMNRKGARNRIIAYRFANCNLYLLDTKIERVMDIVKRDQFIALWRKYFNDAELPVAFYYSKENNNATIVKKAMGHTCIIAQL